MSEWPSPDRSTHAEAKAHCRWRIEDADMKLAQGRIDASERDRLVGEAWSRLEAQFPSPPVDVA